MPINVEARQDMAIGMQHLVFIMTHKFLHFWPPDFCKFDDVEPLHIFERDVPELRQSYLKDLDSTICISY